MKISYARVSEGTLRKEADLKECEGLIGDQRKNEARRNDEQDVEIIRSWIIGILDWRLEAHHVHDQAARRNKNDLHRPNVH